MVSSKFVRCCCCHGNHRGFIRGRDGELPSLVAFKTNYCGGALLATVS